MSTPKDDVSRDGRLIKVCVLGAPQTGKSQLLSQMVGAGFNKTYKPTLGIDYALKDMGADKFGYWDIPGHDRGRFPKIYLTQKTPAESIIVTLDLTNPKALKQATFWIDKAREALPEVPIVLVATKSDLESAPQNTRANIDAFIAEHKLHSYVKTSAKNSRGLIHLQETLSGLTHSSALTPKDYLKPKQLKKLEKDYGRFWNDADLPTSIRKVLESYAKKYNGVPIYAGNPFAPPPSTKSMHKPHASDVEAVVLTLQGLDNPSEEKLAEILSPLTSIDRESGGDFDQLLSYVKEKTKAHWRPITLYELDKSDPTFQSLHATDRPPAHLGRGSSK